jgi:hypothetical protein
MSAAQVQQVIELLAELDGADLDDAERLDLIDVLERAKGAAAAAQARVTVPFVESQLAAGDGSRREQTATRRSIGSQVALARRVSPSAGDRCVGLARALVGELPFTMAALTDGVISERGAMEVVAATAVVDVDVRREVDRRLAGQLAALNAKQVGRAARTAVAELDAAAVVAAHERSVASRRVTVRPAPDGMAYLTVLGPLHETVGAYAALRAHAAAVTAGHGPGSEVPGDRSAGAVMADAALRRLSGRAVGEGQPVAIQLLMTDRSLLGTGDPERSVFEPARVAGHGPVSAPTARAWLRGDDADGDATTWVRRLFTDPSGRDLVGMESRSELFPADLKAFLVLRDDTCRTPYCDAPIAHADHIIRRADGGPTSATNGQGLCARCNLTKEAQGWRVDSDSGGPEAGATHRTITTTPTGHRYASAAPPVLGRGWRPPEPESLDVDWAQIERDHPEWFPELSTAA